ncbi:MAG: hypothetical protein WC809_09835 [Sinimarinibacterium sp.]|jgi:hypothetical protein
MKRISAVVLGVLLVAACATPRVEQQAGPFRQSVGPGGVQQSAGPWGPSQSVGPGGVQQSSGPYGPNQSVGPGGVRQSAGGQPPSGPSCQTSCGGQSYSVSCPAGATPMCQCQHEPYAACMVPGRTKSGG